jgi:hypothetical protein
MFTKSVAISFSVDELRIINEIADEHHISKAAVVRCALKFLDDNYANDLAQEYIEYWIKTNSHRSKRE